MKIRDRIKELRRVPARKLLPNPKNWRVHPPAQQQALKALLQTRSIATSSFAAGSNLPASRRLKPTRRAFGGLAKRTRRGNDVPPAKRSGDDALIAALACGATLESAAQAAGVCVRTAHRRRRDPEFIQRLEAFRADIVQRTAGMVTAASAQAVKTLIELQSASTPASVRLNAARAILDFGIKLRDSAEMEQRIASLEQLLKQGSHDHAHGTPSNPSGPPGESPSVTDPNSQAGTYTQQGDLAT
jgi:hypothetical protein